MLIECRKVVIPCFHPITGAQRTLNRGADLFLSKYFIFSNAVNKHNIRTLITTVHLLFPGFIKPLFSNTLAILSKYEISGEKWALVSRQLSSYEHNEAGLSPCPFCFLI